MPQIPCFGLQFKSIFFLQSLEMVAAVGKLSYNQLVEKIIGYKHSDDSSRVSEGRGPSESLLDIHLSCHQPLSWWATGGADLYSSPALINWFYWWGSWWEVDQIIPIAFCSLGRFLCNTAIPLTLLCWHFSVSGLVAEQFLESTATQLSYHGLCELNTTVKEGELSVFFRNNHFSTMIKHKVRVFAFTKGSIYRV